VICRFRDYGSVTVITAETPTAPADAPPARAALAGAIDVQAHRMDQLSAAIVRATAQVTWSGRAAERFRARAAERSRECLQLAVALRASAERVHVAAMGPALMPKPSEPASSAGAGGGGDFGSEPVAVAAGSAGPEFAR